VPFVNKVPQRTAEQDTAEAERNRSWDPNAALGGKVARAAAAAASAASAAAAAASSAGASPQPAEAAGRRPASDPAAILAGGAAASAAQRPAQPGVDPFVYFVQAGAFTRTDDAEQQRARLALLGQTAKVTEREQAGRTVYRVRLGPYPTRDEADGLQLKLQEQSIEAQIVRVERP
jgi:cell division protein FtsN